MSVMDELCGSGKLGLLSMSCHPERVLCAKDLCSWAVPLRWTEGMTVALKRDITLSSLQRAAALVGQRVVIELV